MQYFTNGVKYISHSTVYSFQNNKFTFISCFRQFIMRKTMFSMVAFKNYVDKQEPRGHPKNYVDKKR